MALAQAGLAVGDVITAVDGADVSDPQALQNIALSQSHWGKCSDHVSPQWADTGWRLALVKAPETVPRDLSPIKGKNPLSGAVIGNLSPAFAEELGIEDATEGVWRGRGGRRFDRRSGCASPRGRSDQ